MKKNLLFALILISFLMSCSPYHITGKITTIQGNQVTVNHKHTFQVNADTLKVGQQVTFTKTIYDKKVNSIKIY